MEYITYKDIKVADIAKISITAILILMWLTDSIVLDLIMFAIINLLGYVIYTVKIKLGAVLIDKNLLKEYEYLIIHIRKGKEKETRFITYIHILPQIILESLIISLAYYTNLINLINSVCNNTNIEIDKLSFIAFLIILIMCKAITIWKLTKNIIRYKVVNI